MEAQAVAGREAAGDRAAGHQHSPSGCAASLQHPAPRAMSSTATRVWARPLPAGPHRVSLDTAPTAKSLATAHEHAPAPGKKAAPQEDGADNFLLDWQTVNTCHRAPLCCHSRLARTGGATRARDRRRRKRNEGAVTGAGGGTAHWGPKAFTPRGREGSESRACRGAGGVRGRTPGLAGSLAPRARVAKSSPLPHPLEQQGP